MPLLRPQSGNWSRERVLKGLGEGAEAYDLIVVGGGITGAGVLREAARAGLRALLVEQRDFAWGTSSRSSKMVHGGLRYLGSGQIGLTRDAVRERQRLLGEAPGLVDPLPFIMPHYRRQFPGPGLFGILLTVYDWLAGQRQHRFIPAGQLRDWIPGLADEDVKGGTRFGDAVTDDARLVLRVLHEATAAGAEVLNYARVTEVRRDAGRVRGVTLRDGISGATFTASAPLVVNATGAWADELRRGQAIRPLRGSHLVFPFWRLPVPCTVSLFHPQDGRPVFIFPWEGVTVVGTTDLDHRDDMQQDARIAPAEVDYLLAIVTRLFPDSGVKREDVLGTWAGVRPVVGTGSADPSKEKREHVIWEEGGLVSVAGGKLTTFRLIARDVLARGRPWLPRDPLAVPEGPVFSPPPRASRPAGLSARQWRRLQGHYGPALPAVLAAGPLEPVETTDTVWAELVWSAGRESVQHLEDLLLRRTRIGHLLPEGGAAILDRVQALCGPVLGWDEARWREERSAYRALWKAAYSLPEGAAHDG